MCQTPIYSSKVHLRHACLSPASKGNRRACGHDARDCCCRCVGETRKLPGSDKHKRLNGCYETQALTADNPGTCESVSKEIHSEQKRPGSRNHEVFAQPRQVRSDFLFADHEDAMCFQVRPLKETGHTPMVMAHKTIAAAAVLERQCVSALF
jgi:hypothetical protein